MAGQEVRAFNVAVAGFAAGLVGPSRGRLQGVLINAAAACAFTIRSGSATGEIILQLTLPVGWNDIYIPNDGILAENGCFVSAFTGAGNVMTLLIE
jgi:hypothetical protein